MGDLSSVWQETETLVEELKLSIQLVSRAAGNVGAVGGRRGTGVGG